MESDPRTELAEIAASLRAYLEVQEDSGAIGIPRGKRTTTTTNSGPTATTGSAAGGGAPEPTVSAPFAARPPPQTSTSTPTSTSPSTELSPAPSTPTPTALPDADPTVRLPLLQAEVAGCTKCGLATTRTKTVFSRGSHTAKLVFLGEAPGADEDAAGIPFVGRAGQLLDKMIAAMGLDAGKDVYVCNILKCRPPDNRRPTSQEMETCFPYVHEQLQLVSPDVIVALGNTAVAALLGTNIGITKLRGQWKLYRGKIPVMPTYHPSYLLRPSETQAESKKQAWDDLKEVLKKLGREVPAKKT